jgi:hypothetical protein
MRMKIKDRVKLTGICMVLSLILLSCVAQVARADEQTGVLLPEPVDVRVDTLEKFSIVVNNYTYVADAVGTDTWRLIDGTQPFKGDCEDFAFAMQHLVGAGSVYSVYRYSTGDVDHAVFVHGGSVWDLDGIAMPVASYELQRGHVMFRLGDFSPESR